VSGLDGPGRPLDEARGPGEVRRGAHRLEAFEPRSLGLEEHVDSELGHDLVKEQVDEGVGRELQVPLEAARRYRLSDVTAGSSGNEGGDS